MTDEDIAWVVQRLRDLGCKVIETRKLTDGSVTVRIANPKMDEHRTRNGK